MHGEAWSRGNGTRGNSGSRGRGRSGCSSRRGTSVRWSSNCSPVRSASSPDGGTATRRSATISSPAPAMPPWSGSTGKTTAGSCMASLPESLPAESLPAATLPAASVPAYAELHCLSNFSFLRGASHPEELVEHAAALGYSALALTDECSLAGVVRAHVAPKETGLQLIVGTEI